MLPKGEPPGVFSEIHLAARNRDADRVLALLKAGVEPDIRNQREPNGDGGNTPLWFAAQGARSGGVPVAAVLLDAGASIDERCEYGTTALHLAASWGHLDMVRFLIGRGADRGARDDAGQTAVESLQAAHVRIQDEINRGAGPADGEDWLARTPAVIDFLSAQDSTALIPPADPQSTLDRPTDNAVLPAVRRANRLLFIGLVVFAVVLAVVVFLWMRGVVKANGGIVDPQRRTSLYLPSQQPVTSADFVLPISPSCFN